MKTGIKTVFGAAALLAAFAAPAAAQSVQFGAAAGVNMANISGEDFADTDSRTAPFFEAQLVWHPVGSTFGFQTGAVFSPKGVKAEEGNADIELKVDYVDVPLLVRIAVPVGSTIHPVLLLGGTAGFKTSCSLEGEEGGVSVDVDCDEQGFELDVKSFDFGLTGGAALDFFVADGMVLSPFVRYTHGLTEIAEGEDGKHKVLQLGASFRIAM